MKASTTVKVNGEAIRRALLKRGVKITEASKAIGMSACYLSRALSGDEMRESNFKLLCYTYNLDPREYLVKPEAEEIPVDDVAKVLRILLQRTEPGNVKKLIKEAYREL